MNQIEKNNHNEIQVKIIQSSIRQLNYAIVLCGTNQSDYWQTTKKETELKLKGEELELECYKISNPELFI